MTSVKHVCVHVQSFTDFTLTSASINYLGCIFKNYWCTEQIRSDNPNIMQHTLNFDKQKRTNSNNKLTEAQNDRFKGGREDIVQGKKSYKKSC